jgi:NAD(P)-dependent dehydrogenase (short-subunit alcohol dehydrogenase family)
MNSNAGTSRPVGAELVYVVDDDEAVRDSLRWLLEGHGFRVSPFESSERFLASLQPGTTGPIPGCLIVDVRMPGMTGVELVEQVRRIDEDLPVILMTAFGTIDILVNNAGVALVDMLLDAKVEDWDATMAVNLRAPFLLSRELVPAMIAQKAGKIINVSSQAGVIGLDAHGAYCASKGGLNMLTKVMTSEWAKHNIQINTVCPTVILTPMGEQVWGQPEKGDPMKAKIPGGRFGKPIEVADAILFLASSASGMICGHDLLIDGGYTAI